MEPSARIAACPQVRDLSDAASYAESPDSAAEVFGAGNLAVLLAERERCRSGTIGSTWRKPASRDFRLKVGGLVENPVELSLADLEQLGEIEHITMHHCIQGWSGIAKWGGIPMKTLIELVQPKPEAKVVAFFSFGEALYGGPYYDTQSLENVLKPQCLLASRMNGQRLPEVYGAPLRLRVENQLGYKMVKWIERIEFIESEKMLGKGEGGKNEDDEYFDLLPNI